MCQKQKEAQLKLILECGEQVFTKHAKVVADDDEDDGDDDNDDDDDDDNGGDDDDDDDNDDDDDDDVEDDEDEDSTCLEVCRPSNRRVQPQSPSLRLCEYEHIDQCGCPWPWRW